MLLTMVEYKRMSKYLLQFDGSCEDNPGHIAGYGLTILKNDIQFYEESGKLAYGPIYSNNSAEFFAVYKGLKKLYSVLESGDTVLVQGDSLLAVNILNKKWRAKQKSLYYPAYKLAFDVLNSIKEKQISVTLQWISRVYNERADELSR